MASKINFNFNFKSYSSILALLLLFIILSFLTQGDFLDPRNFTNLSRQISVNALLAVGMTFVILTAGIDLSVGSVVALCGIVLGILQVKFDLINMGALGAGLSILACVATGLLTGLINGTLISFFKIPPFVITLGMMVIARGLALIFSNSQAISPLSSELRYFAKGFTPYSLTIILIGIASLFWLKSAWQRIKKYSMNLSLGLTLLVELSIISLPLYSFLNDRGFPIPVVILILCSGLALFFLARFPLGRYIYAVGGNEEASELSGINVRGVKCLVYTIMGFLAGVGAVILSARLNSATPTEGNLMELDAIAAVVIGGTSLMGGTGSVVGSLIGAFLIGTLNNGMDLLDVNSNYQMVFKGLIIIFAVWADARTKAKGN